MKKPASFAAIGVEAGVVARVARVEAVAVAGIVAQPTISFGECICNHC